MRPLAVSMGEPAGVGPDIILDLYCRRAELGLPPFVVYGHKGFLGQRARRLGLEVTFGGPDVDFAEALPVHDIAGDVPDTPGVTHAPAAHVVVQAIARAVADTLSGACRAVVTAPINKGALYATGFAHPGHTEFLAELASPPGHSHRPVMMLAHEAAGLRVVPLTIHVPLHEVPGLVTRSLVEETGRIVAHDLRTRFAIANPRIGIAGLNPHAGEGGTIGREDADIIGPAIAALRHAGIEAEGPFPADTLFYPPHWQRYDAVIAMYHDQALIPIKTVAFDSAVNVTLGLPVVRTSPDHGTAFDLAGTGKASATSFAQALLLADRMTR